MSNQRARVDEEDDLDDLDDVLDQFSAPAAPQPAPPATASTSAQPTQPAADPLSDEFAAEFARGMESLLNELGIAREAGSDGAGADAGADKGGVSEREQLAAAWEAMLVEGMDAMADPSTSTSLSRPSGTDFQSRIRSTVDRLRESESGLHPSGSDTSAGNDALDPLLSRLMGLDGVGDGPQSEAQLRETLDAVMGQLMSKEVLYEPLKELYEKFPKYIADHDSTISPEDRARYEAQIACIKRLIDEFESSSYRDEDGGARERIVALMGELQTHGQPPEEIMGPLPPGFSMGADGLPEIPDGCNMS